MIEIHYLTLIEPYASLIALPASDPRAKRVENRTWAPRGFLPPTPQRPLPLLIHAGKATRYGGRPVTEIAAQYGLTPDQLRPGHAIAIASCVAFLPIEQVRQLPETHPLAWTKSHMHTEGPWCWVLGEVAPIEPFAMSGAQGLQKTTLDPKVLSDDARRILGLAALPPKPLHSDLIPPAAGPLLPAQMALPFPVVDQISFRHA